MTCLHCQQPIESKTEQAPRCLQIRSSGYIVWKRMHDLCLDLYLTQKPGFKLIEGERADRFLQQTVQQEAERKARRESDPETLNNKDHRRPLRIKRVQRPLRLGELLKSRMLQQREKERSR